ncbi:uncharacterized protein F5147DRAFT_769760 [Suillus discolor]|uniref:Uncharacterized protein n=1 Tax=Suillus discolor TaxID=1912936 RepID=A0A9P7FDS3_9AGAM|nr:uncharacterized protein F5147DRAFT_769760 [Suillus discolor]KAG2115304.1 hypothetical protein F5147DRAFT_769760 [Suillus discolor]
MSNRKVHFSSPLVSGQERSAANTGALPEWTTASKSYLAKLDVPTSLESQQTDSIMQDDVDELVEDGPSYNLGWADILAKSATAVSTSVDDFSTGPSYDLRWGATKTSNIAAENMSELIDPEEGLVYNLGWGVSDISSRYRIDGRMEVLDGGDDGPIPDNIIDLCGDDRPVYNLGWGYGQQEVIELSDDQPNDDRNVNEGFRNPVHGDMDINQDSKESSAIKIIEDDYEGTQTILRVNCRLKTFGNTLTDEHMHAMIENTTNGLTASHAPAEILLENRDVLRGYVDAQKQVTNAERDICRLH